MKGQRVKSGEVFRLNTDALMLQFSSVFLWEWLQNMVGAEGENSRFDLCYRLVAVT